MRARTASRVPSALLCAFLLACVSSDEVARVAAPGGRIEAVLIETNGGATTSFGYDVAVVPAGNSTRFRGNVATLYGAVRSDSAYGVNLRWATPSELHIEYLYARQAALERPSIMVDGRRIRVALDSAVSDPTAPRGGMLWNVQGRP